MKSPATAHLALVSISLLGLALGLGACSAPPQVGRAAAPQTPSPPEAPSWRLPTPPPPLPDRPLKAAFLLLDGVFNTELVAPFDVFEHSRVAVGDRPPIEVFTVSPDGAPVTTAEGLVIAADHGFADHPPIDILVVASAEGSRGADLEDEDLIGWVREQGGRARYVMSLCWGAFVLAEAGLLDGRAATTFPPDQDDLAASYPAVDVRRGVSLVHDGPALTSEGGVSSFEAAMYLIDYLYGEQAARRIGGGLLIPWPPALEVAERFVVVGREGAR